MQIGRIEIFTDEREITSNNIIQVLQKAMPYHEINAQRINYLLEFEAGEQPLTRKKKVRPDIDCSTVDNLAAEITDFKRGYFWGNPITLVQRGVSDSGKKNESAGIALLNEFYEAEGIKAKTQALGRFVEITGIGYTYVDVNTDYQEGDSYFEIEPLHPCFAFVIKSSYYIDHRPMVGVSFRVDENGSRHYTAITKDSRYEIEELCKIVNGVPQKDKEGNDIKVWDRNGEGVKNPLGIVNIIEWTRSPDRMGCFEKQIPQLIDLNLLQSNISNQVEEVTQCIWHTNDVDLRKEVQNVDGTTSLKEVNPGANDWVHTYTTPDGKTPFIKPLTVPYDYAGQLNNIMARRAWVKEKCHVPMNNDNSGGSTGIAMEAATGWNDAEVDASMEQQTVEPCKMNEVKVVLAAIKVAVNVLKVPANEILELRYIDIQPNMKRSKTYEMTSKINTYCAGVSHGLAPEHMVRAINFFEDPNQVIEDSKPYMDRYLKSIYEGNSTEEETHMQDESDQRGQSPFIDSMRTGESVNEEVDTVQ